jgi:MOSC domain-containing protein YiiM
VRVLSVNVGRPREIEWHGELVLTSIFKDPVSGPVRVRTLNLDGDQQSDLTVHGGASKAIYVYPIEHYAFWRAELPASALPMGAFGENLTTEGLLEDALRIGDVLHVGSVEAVVTQPRMPCFKLGIRFGRLDMPKRFWRSRRCGLYLRVLREGEITAGDIIVHEAAATGPTIADVFARWGRAG